MPVFDGNFYFVNKFLKSNSLKRINQTVVSIFSKKKFVLKNFRLHLQLAKSKIQCISLISPFLSFLLFFWFPEEVRMVCKYFGKKI